MAEVLMFFALDADRTVVDVTQVAKGAACACVCLGCGAPLLAKQGAVNAWHFGHASGASHRACAETALHLAGKELLRDMSEVLVPAVSVDLSAVDVLKRKHTQPVEADAFPFTFSTCSLEHTTGSRRLDALLESQDGQRLGIEILVTHKVCAQKAKALACLNAPVLEIDLSKWVGKPLDRVALKSVLATGAPRSVVAGRDVLLASQVLKSTTALAQRLEGIERAVRRVMVLPANESVERQQIVERMGLSPTPWPEWLNWSEWLEWQPLKDEPRQLFGAHHSVWQAACAEFLSRYPSGKKFTAQNVVDAVNLVLRAPDYEDHAPEFKGITAFLREHLVDLGRVKFCGNDDHGWGEDWYRSAPPLPKRRDEPDNGAQLALF